MNKSKIEIQKKQETLFLEYFDKFEDKFSIKRNYIFRNKKRIIKKINKNKRKNRFDLWKNLPFSLIIYAINARDFHYMFNYFYFLKDLLIVKSFRKGYSTNILEKKYIGYDCYRVYSNNLLKLYDNMEEIVNYDLHIIGIEIEGQLYTIKKITKYFQTIKEDLKFFFNYVPAFNMDFNKTFRSFDQLDLEFNQNIQEILLICQHITK